MLSVLPRIGKRLSGAIPARDRDKTTHCKMEATERINIRGAIKALDAVGEQVAFPRNDDYKPSSIRSIAGSVKCDTGRRFRVEVGKDSITVTRKS